MFSAILSFLGGSAFRMLLGELSAFFTKRQDHLHQVQLLELEARTAGEAHARNLEAIRVQAELGVRTIEVQADADERVEAARAFREAQATLWRPSGIVWVDAWNASVRPAFATVVLGLWCLSLHRAGWVPTQWDLDMMGGVAGFFFADRALTKKGK